MKNLNPVIYICGFAECTQNLILVPKGWEGFTIPRVIPYTISLSMAATLHKEPASS
jgi:hypothetical protein